MIKLNNHSKEFFLDYTKIIMIEPMYSDERVKTILTIVDGTKLYVFESIDEISRKIKEVMEACA